MDEGIPVGAAAPRQTLLHRKGLRDGWLCVAVGLLIPFLALWGARVGWVFRRQEPARAWTLFAAGMTVFVVRMVIYLG